MYPIIGLTNISKSWFFLKIDEFFVSESGTVISNFHRERKKARKWGAWCVLCFQDQVHSEQPPSTIRVKSDAIREEEEEEEHEQDVLAHFPS